jgi:hypothetical protein
MSTDELRTAVTEAAVDASHSYVDAVYGSDAFGHTFVDRDLMRAVVDAVLPLLVAGTASRIADEIQSTTYYVYPPPEGLSRARLDGLREARDAAAAIARRVGETS